jgi:hypothetical protein
VHLDDLARGVNADAVDRGGAFRTEAFPDRGLIADEHDPGVLRLLQKLQRSRDRYPGAVIAAHRVDGNGDLHQPATSYAWALLRALRGRGLARLRREERPGASDCYASPLVLTTFLPR